MAEEKGKEIEKTDRKGKETRGKNEIEGEANGMRAIKDTEEIKGAEKEAGLEQIRRQTAKVLEELLEKADVHPGDILVAGCSSSEIGSFQIGSHSSAEIGMAVFETLYQELKARGIYLAAQCCEHLNRALILEREAVKRYGLDPVNVVPRLKAGGSFATAAYAQMEHPEAVEHIKAHCGIDIGDTLIGMHLRDVAVPVRVSVRSIGGAHVVCARTRPKFIGGSRACYDETRM